MVSFSTLTPVCICPAAIFQARKPMTQLVDPSHFAALAQCDPQEVCRRTGCSHDPDNHSYALPFWRKTCRIHPANRTIRWQNGPLHDYLGLVAIHYLLTGKEVLPTGNWVSEKDLPGGATFFRGPHAIPSHAICDRLNNSPSTFAERALALGGTPLAMADAAASFAIAGRLPVAILYWAGDEEFPAEARLLFDETITAHFALDIVFALAVGVCEEFARLA